LETQEKLVDWQYRFDQLWGGNPTDEMDAALVHCLQRNSIPRKPFCDMICGMQSDAVDGRRVATMEALEEYAYQVAGTVGLMLLPLLNAKNMKDAEYPAICLGKAIQLINILRDASPDAALGRIYLPQDLLQAQKVQNEDVLALKSSRGYRNVVKSVSNRAWTLLEQAEEGRNTLPGLGPLFVQVIVELYRGYLDELERREYNNLTVEGERVKIGTSRKLMASIIALKKVML
jgi:phytoene synthase